MMPVEHRAPAMEDRAFEVQMLLAVDKVFDLIAGVTGQSAETLRTQ